MQETRHGYLQMKYKFIDRHCEYGSRHCEERNIIAIPLRAGEAISILNISYLEIASSRLNPKLYFVPRNDADSDEIISERTIPIAFGSDATKLNSSNEAGI